MKIPFKIKQRNEEGTLPSTKFFKSQTMVWAESESFRQQIENEISAKKLAFLSPTAYANPGT